MLETVDTSKKIDRKAYHEWFPRLKSDLRELQQAARTARIPVIVIFEGWHLSGKADTILHLTEALDPRGFTVHDILFPTPEEHQRHWLHRFWTQTPPCGKIALFERSWYMRVLGERVETKLSKTEVSHAFQDINRTEEMLVKDGAVIVKFWLQISKKQQKQRFKEIEDDPFLRLHLNTVGTKSVKKYDEYETVVEEMLERTSTAQVPWVIVEAGDHRYRRMKIFQALCEALANAINQKPKRTRATSASKNGNKDTENAPNISVPVLEEMPTVLDTVDHSKVIDDKEYDVLKKKLQRKLRDLQFQMVTKGIPMLIVYEGWDAAGKGGNIRRLTAQLDARYYSVVPISKPTQEELDHHYLWRFWKAIPEKGQITILDRSHYGRVLVERIESFATEDEWRRAYQEINEFELMLYQSGMVIIKFWLEITKDEQLNRFEARSKNPDKSWKLTDEDWRNREKWDIYRESVDDMIKKTSTTYAPWTIVEGNCKQWARVRTMNTVIAEMEKALGKK